MMEEIKKRLEKITPGEWFRDLRYAPFAVAVKQGKGEKSICSTGGYSDNRTDQEQLRAWQEADAEFIAHAPADLRWAVAEIERLEEVLSSAQMTQNEVDYAGRTAAQSIYRSEVLEADNAQLRAALERVQYDQNTGVCLGCGEGVWREEDCAEDCDIANALKGKD